MYPILLEVISVLLDKVFNKEGFNIYNLGTGIGYSVLEIIKAFSKVCGKQIPYKFLDRRDGDLACVYSNPTKKYEELGFKTEKNLEDMCKDTWNWQINIKNEKKI